MFTLNDVRKQNMLLAAAGINFGETFFRKLAAQHPQKVDKFTISTSDEGKREKKFKKLIQKNHNDFVLIFRNDQAELEEVLFVPARS